MGVEHGGVVHVLPVAGQRGLDRQRLDVDVGLHQGSQLWRQGPDRGRLDPVGIDQARHLDTGALGQVVDQAVVGHVAVHHAGLAGLHRVDDASPVLVARGDFQLGVGRFEVGSHVLPSGDLANTAPWVLVDRDAVLVEQVLASVLDEPRDVLGEVLA